MVAQGEVRFPMTFSDAETDSKHIIINIISPSFTSFSPAPCRTRNSGTSLHIYDTRLRSVDLENLRQVSNGNILIAKNSRLCYVEKINWQRLVTNQPQPQSVTVVQNADEAECGERMCGANPTWDLSGRLRGRFDPP